MGIFGQRQQGQPNNDGELHNLQVTEAVFGTCLPILIGTRRLHAKLFFYGGFHATPVPNSGKGVFGGKSTQFDYFADVISGLCQGPTDGLLSVWDQNGKLQNQSGTYIYTIPSGGGSVIPQSNPPIQQDLGVSKAVAYSVTANDYGSGGPVTYSGTQQVVMPPAPGAPGPGQYGYDPSTGTYSFNGADAGSQVTISYSAVFSLYYFQAVQPAIIPASSPWQISTDNEAYFNADEGVTFYSVSDGNTAGVKVGGTPTAHYQYHEAAGVYTFYSGDAGKAVYIKYQYYSSDPDITNSSHLNLTFFNGAQSQPPWSYMTSKYAGAAFGFTGVCYVGANPMALGESASLPSYNYEIVGRGIFGGGNYDALVPAAMALLLTDGLVGINFPSAWMGDWSLATAYHAANGFFISDVLDTQQPAAQAMQRWLDTGNIAAVWSGGLLKLIPYGDTTAVGNGFTYTPPTTPAVTLLWADIQKWTDGKTGQKTNDDPIQIAVKAPQDCLNYVQCQWTNRGNDYNNELTVEQNDAYIQLYGFRPEASQTWDFISTQTAATWALNLRLKRNCYIRNGYKFKLSFRFSYLEPMDLVVLPTGENVRILQIDDDPDGMLTISAEQWSYGTADVTLYPKQVSSSYQPNVTQAIAGDTSAYIFEATPSSVLSEPNTVQIAVAGQQPAWGGCNIYVSTDGNEYSLVPNGKVQSANRAGLLSAILGSNPDPDTTDTLSVDMSISGGELVSVTAAQRDSFVSLSAIADPSGSLELISFETASLTGADRYDLTSLRRGVFGSTIGSHAVGSEFVYLGSQGVFQYQYPPQYAGLTVYFKFSSFNLAGNQPQSLTQCKAYPFTIPGTTLQNPSGGVFSTNPVGVLAAQSTGATAQIMVANFEAMLNNLTANCTVANPISGLNQGQLYYVYYIDMAFLGGVISPIATQNVNDFTGKSGFYSLGSIVTPTVPSGGGGGGAPTGPWRPTSFFDYGTHTTSNPSYAYDGNPSTAAAVNALAINQYSGATNYYGGCEWYVFQNVVPTFTVTLYVTAEVSFFGPTSGSATLEYTFDGGTTWTVFFTTTTNLASTQYTAAVPSGTNLSQIQVRAFSSVTTPTSYGGESAVVYVYGISVS